MSRSRLVAALVAVVVAGVLGTWLGGRSVPLPSARPTGAVPIAPGAPERVDPLLPAADNSGGLGGSDVALTPDGRTLVTVGAPGVGVQIADLGPSGVDRIDQIAVGTPTPPRANNDSYAQERRALALGPDGRSVWVTDGWGRRVLLVDLPTRAVVAQVAIPAIPTAVAVAGGTVAVGDATGAVTTLDAATRRPLGFRDVGAGPAADLVATPDGRHVVLATDPGGDSADGTVSLVDLTDPAAPSVPYDWPVKRPRGLGGTSMAVSPDGLRAYVVTGPRLGGAAPDAATAGGVVVLDLRAGREVTTLPGPETTGLALSPDGRRLYLARDPELRAPSGPDPLFVLDAVDITAITTTVTTPTSDIDSGPGGRPIGSLTQETSTGGNAWVVPGPDGRHLYALVGSAAVVTLRAG